MMTMKDPKILEMMIGKTKKDNSKILEKIKKRSKRKRTNKTIPRIINLMKKASTTNSKTDSLMKTRRTRRQISNNRRNDNIELL